MFFYMKHLIVMGSGWLSGINNVSGGIHSVSYDVQLSWPNLDIYDYKANGSSEASLHYWSRAAFRAQKDVDIERDH